MKQTYYKTGLTLRLERRDGQRALIRSVESGFATDSDEGYSTTSRSCEETESREPAELFSLDEAIEKRLSNGTSLGRATIGRGTARHELREDETTRSWTDQWVRVHLSIQRLEAGIRAWVDFGSTTIEELDLSIVERVSSTLQFASHIKREISEPAHLSPGVSAALWSALCLDQGRLSSVERSGSGLRIEQTAGEGLDGDGLAVKPMVLFDGSTGLFADRGELPNRFRPSYRIRPVSFPFHTRAECDGEPLDADVTVESLLGAIRIAGETISMPVLCGSKTGEAFAAEMTSTKATLIAAVRHVSGDQRWFPHAAGAWGATTHLERCRLVPLSL